MQNVNRSFSASLRLSGALLFRSLCCSRRKDKCDSGDMAESAMSEQKASCRKRGHETWCVWVEVGPGFAAVRARN